MTRTIPACLSAWSFCGICSLFCLSPCIAAESPSPVGLLRGVYSARASYEFLSVQLTFEDFKDSEKVTQAEISIKERDQKRILKIITSPPTPDIVEQTILVAGIDEVHNYRREKHSDLEVFDLQRAVDHGLFGFDPRTLGLSEALSIKTTLKDCTAPNKQGTITLDGKEEIEGVSTWKVKYSSNSSPLETIFWIEEPSFRVYKRTTTVPGYLRLEIYSFYDDSKNHSPFPSKVISKRYEQEKLRQERICSDITWDFAPFEDSHLSIAAFDLPVNTPVVDYRISRRLGYWDGNKIAENLVRYPQKETEQIAKQQVPPSRVNWLIVINVVFLLFIAFLYFKKKRSRAQN